MNHRSIAFLFIVFVGLSTVLAGQTPSFVARRDFRAPGPAKNSVAVADLNGDGIPDMVSVGPVTLSVFLGNGDGTFQPASNISQGGRFVAVADLNGDGIPDLAVVLGNSVFILLGKGNGDFQSPMQFSTGNPSDFIVNSDFIAVGDFNGDSIPDLAITNQGNPTTGQGSSLSVLLGNGDGTFSAATNYAVGTGPMSVAIGDFNNDGVADLVVANQGDRSGPDGTFLPDTRISILIGNGDGSFAAAQNLSVGNGPTAVVVGDFNRDGNADVAVALQGGSDPQHGSVHILLGDGTGGFSDSGSFPTGNFPSAIALGDVNGDGIADLLVTTTLNKGAVTVLLGNGDGTFNSAPDVPVAENAIALALADLNGDGALDIVTTTQAGGVSVIFGNGDGTFQTAPELLPGPTAQFSVTADFNQDGIPDVAFSGDSTGSNTVSVMLGKGDGTFQTPVTTQLGDVPILEAAADLNGDGFPDLVVSTAGQLAVMLGNGDGTFQSPIFVGTQITSVAVGDVNGDGIPDLIASSNPNNAGSSALVYLGNGDGTFQSPTSLGIVAKFLTVGDFNRDGNLDIALTSGTSNVVSILLGNGDGTFQPPVQTSTPPGTPFRLAVGDFNNDGLPDLAVTFNSQDGSATLLVMIGHGDGTFDNPVGYATNGSSSVVVADMNGDGIQDLVVNTGNSVAVLIGNGDGGFQPAVLFGPGGLSMAIADFNSDGKPDVFVGWASFGSRGPALLINNHL